MYSIRLWFLCISVILFSIFTACKQDAADAKDTQSADTTGGVSADTAVAVNLNSPVAHEEVLLRLKPAVGAVFVVENASSFSSDETMDTLRIKASSSKWIKAKLVVKESTDKLVKLEFTVTDARKTVKDDSGTLNYSYGKPMSNPEDETNRKIEDCLVNAPLTLLMSPKGESTDVEGYEKIVKKVKDIVGAQVPDQMIAANIGSPTDNLEYYFVNYPDSAVKIGETWSFDAPSVLQGVPITLSTTYTLADRNDGISYINFNTVVSVDKSQLPPEMASEVDKIKFKAGLSGTGQIDEETGWPIIMKVHQFMQVSDTYQGMSTSSKQEGNTTIRWIK